MVMRMLLVVIPLLLGDAPALAQPAEVILMRHGDKDRQRGDYNLSPRGFRRAINLGRLLPACFGPIERIGSYRLAVHSEKNARSYQTAVPLAVATGINIEMFTDSADGTPYDGAELLQDRSVQGKTVVLFWEHRRMAALAMALGWDGMPSIEKDDFDGLYRLRYTPGNFLPDVTVSRQSKLFQRACFVNATSPLPALPLP